MGEGVIASVSVGGVVFIALILLAFGAGLGWWIRRRQEAKDEHADSLSLLNAIPQAALIVDNAANIRIKNIRASQLMNESGWETNLPNMLIEAVGRVGSTGLTERREIVTGEKKFQVLATPLHATKEAQVLILIADSADGSYRAELYQQLVGTIAHELRTPLTAIMGHVEILNSCGIDEETLWRRSLGFVAGETDRLARLVEDLLSLSRLDRVPMHLQPINLRVAAEEAVSELFDFAEKNNASLILQAAADLPRALADPERIRQVFLNLIDNAIKHASNHPVTIRLTPTGEAVSVEVNNRGTPIAEEDLPHLFEPFWRGKQTNAKGTGLGLAIVRAILEQHHSSIGVTSNAEHGTTFYFSLPIASV
ncbi:MAG: HAMP domain-containing sensor histidine kinase [Chloroflexota bacterium]